MHDLWERYRVTAQVEWGSRTFSTAIEVETGHCVHLVQEPASGLISPYDHPALPPLRTLLVRGVHRWLLASAQTGTTFEQARLHASLSAKDVQMAARAVSDALGQLGQLEPPQLPALLDPACIRRGSEGGWIVDFLELAHRPGIAGGPPGTSEVYPVGVFLYWLVTGQFPRPAGFQASDIPEGVPTSLRHIVISCLSSSYPSLAECNADIERLDLHRVSIWLATPSSGAPADPAPAPTPALPDSPIWADTEVASAWHGEFHPAADPGQWGRYLAAAGAAVLGIGVAVILMLWVPSLFAQGRAVEGPPATPAPGPQRTPPPTSAGVQSDPVAIAETAATAKRIVAVTAPTTKSLPITPAVSYQVSIACSSPIAVGTTAACMATPDSTPASTSYAVHWTASGGSLSIGPGYQAAFKAEAPGTYRVEARLDSASASTEVVVQSPVHPEDENVGASAARVYLNNEPLGFAYLFGEFLPAPFLSAESCRTLFGRPSAWTPLQGGILQIQVHGRAVTTRDFEIVGGRPWLKLTPELLLRLGLFIESKQPGSLYLEDSENL